MNDQDKALIKLEDALRRLSWVRTHMREGTVHPKGECCADLGTAKRMIRGVQGEIEDWTEPTNGGVIIDTPKPDWMPKMICSIVQLPFNVGQHYSWEELEAVIAQLSLAGCDAMRIFGNGWEPSIEAFFSVNGKYSFFKPNPEWDITLKRFGDLLHKYHMSLEVEAYDNCSHNLDWNPFKNSIHNFSHQFYGYENQIKTDQFDKETEKIIYLNEVDFMIEYWDDRIIGCLDFTKGDKYRLGNELKSHVDGDVSERKIWAEKWGVKRAKYAFDRRMPQPISFSGSENTGHKLHGFISAEEHPEYGWTYRTAALEVHGKGTPEHVAAWAEGGISQRRVFADDDDGVGTNPDSKVPLNQRGYCEIKKNGMEYACTADTPTRVEAARAFIKELGNRTYCYSIGFLPRSILYKGKTDFSRFDIKVDAEIYSRIALDLWNFDIRRKWSDE